MHASNERRALRHCVHANGNAMHYIVPHYKTSHVTLYAFKGTSLFMLLSMKGDHANGAVQLTRAVIVMMVAFKVCKVVCILYDFFQMHIM